MIDIDEVVRIAERRRGRHIAKRVVFILLAVLALTVLLNVTKRADAQIGVLQEYEVTGTQAGLSVNWVSCLASGWCYANIESDGTQSAYMTNWIRNGVQLSSGTVPGSGVGNQTFLYGGWSVGDSGQFRAGGITITFTVRFTVPTTTTTTTTTIPVSSWTEDPAVSVSGQAIGGTPYAQTVTTVTDTGTGITFSGVRCSTNERCGISVRFTKGLRYRRDFERNGRDVSGFGDSGRWFQVSAARDIEYLVGGWSAGDTGRARIWTNEGSTLVISWTVTLSAPVPTVTTTTTTTIPGVGVQPIGPTLRKVGSCYVVPTVTTAEANALKAAIIAAFPETGQTGAVWYQFCSRRISGSSTWSEHAWGNALDLMVRGPVTIEIAQRVETWLEARRSSLCELIGLDVHADHIHVAPNPCRAVSGAIPPGLERWFGGGGTTPNMEISIPTYSGGTGGSPGLWQAHIGHCFEGKFMWDSGWNVAEGVGRGLNDLATSAVCSLVGLWVTDVDWALGRISSVGTCAEVSSVTEPGDCGMLGMLRVLFDAVWTTATLPTSGPCRGPGLLLETWGISGVFGSWDEGGVDWSRAIGDTYPLSVCEGAILHAASTNTTFKGALGIIVLILVNRAAFNAVGRLTGMKRDARAERIRQANLDDYMDNIPEDYGYDGLPR